MAGRGHEWTRSCSSASRSPAGTEKGESTEAALEPEKGEGGAIAIEQNGTLQLDEALDHWQHRRERRRRRRRRRGTGRRKQHDLSQHRHRRSWPRRWDLQREPQCLQSRARHRGQLDDRGQLGLRRQHQRGRRDLRRLHPETHQLDSLGQQRSRKRRHACHQRRSHHDDRQQHHRLRQRRGLRGGHPNLTRRQRRRRRRLRTHQPEKDQRHLRGTPASSKNRRKRRSSPTTVVPPKRSRSPTRFPRPSKTAWNSTVPPATNAARRGPPGKTAPRAPTSMGWNRQRSSPAR